MLESSRHTYIVYHSDVSQYIFDKPYFPKLGNKGTSIEANCVFLFVLDQPASHKPVRETNLNPQKRHFINYGIPENGD